MGGTVYTREYERLFDAWMKARADSGDTLTQEQEAEWTAKVDAVWSLMTKKEQDAAELYAREALLKKSK